MSTRVKLVAAPCMGAFLRRLKPATATALFLAAAVVSRADEKITYDDQVTPIFRNNCIRNGVLPVGSRSMICPWR